VTLKKITTIDKIFKYIMAYKLKIGFSLGSSIIVASVNAAPAYIVQTLLDNVLAQKSMFYLRLICIGLPLLLFIKGIFYFLQNYFMAYVGQKMVINIRYDVFSHLQKVSLSFFAKKNTGSLISKLTNDVNVVRAMVKGCTDIITDFITLIILFAYIFYLHWKLTLLVFVVLPFIGAIVAKFSKKIRRVGHDMQEKLADVTAILHEAISGVHITRAFTMEDEEIDKFSKKDEESLRSQMKGVKLQATVLPIVELMNTIGIAIVMYYGGMIVISGELTSGELVGFLAAAGMTLSPIKKLTNVNSVFQQSIAAAERIFEIMDEEIEQDEEDSDLIPVSYIKGDVEFDNVSFTYDGKSDVLRNIDLKVKSGKIVAFVGPSGAGKSTIISLIPRFYNVNKGKILIDGININNYKLKDLRRHISVVPQDTILFSGSIAENISYGNPEASQEEIIQAAKMANAHNTQVGERGAMLSGGQRQRIAIARALLRDAKILILDEATSALDSESESLVQDALEYLMKDRTTFVIAHRLSTIRKADVICVIDNGKIVQSGNHEQLMEKGGEYRQIYNAQFYFLEEGNSQ
jgi:subfamily B ATP-binding cassette protein MsbA